MLLGEAVTVAVIMRAHGKRKATAQGKTSADSRPIVHMLDGAGGTAPPTLLALRLYYKITCLYKTK